MDSNTHKDGQIVVSKDITLTSPPRNTYGSNNAEASSSNIFALPKNEEQLKSSEQHDNDNENKGAVTENLEAIAADKETGLSPIEEEINICDTCGDRGFPDYLVICSECKIGAEHTYCMTEKVADRLGWFCYDCTEDKDEVRDGDVDPNKDMNEEPSSRKRRIGPSIDPRMAEEKEAKRRRPHSFDLNEDPNPDLEEE